MAVAQLQEIQGTEGLVFVAHVPKPEILSNWLFWLIAGYAVLYIVYQRLFVKRRKHRVSRKACIFLARTAAESLKQGNTVRASLSMDRLLSALSDFIKQKLVSLATIQYAPRNSWEAALFVTLNFWYGTRSAPQNLIYVRPEKIPRKAVFQVIASGYTGGFQERLRDLATGLDGNIDKRYLSASEFLTWLDRETELYQKDYSKSFFERYPALKVVLTTLGPLIVALAAVATLITQTPS